jgi:tetratricopeptide (TPR) repeat protein
MSSVNGETMGNLLNFAVYNPAILSDEDFLAGFIARQSLAESLLQGLRRIEPDGLAKHRLIIGQRGMGKTSLLRRLALGVAQDAELSARFLPLTFREEQYNVHNWRTFWNNCLDALGDCFERAGLIEQAEGVDRDIANLERTTDADGEAACRLFKDWCKRENKRPLLLLDNIDIILDGLTKQDWAFRRVLQERGGAVVFGATVNPLEATAKIEAAFYDFFQVTVLEKLSFPELMDCLRQLAAMRGEDGQKVRRVLDRDQARIHTLYDFTGGNPRTLVLLYLLLELDPEEDVMSDLERLLDQVSVLYKARVEDLAPQARVVLDAVALNWNPAALARIKEITGLETGSIAGQLDRLQKNGIIEKTALSTAGSSGYQLGERLFNIWYLMRHGQRRQRNRLRWLSEFLRGFYGPDQLRDMARGMVGRPNRSGLSGGQYSLAMREAVDEPVLQRLLDYHATSEFERHAEETRSAIQQFIDLEDLDGETHTMAELKKAVLNCQREWPEGTSAVEFWELLGGSLDLSQADKSRIVEQIAKQSAADLLELTATFRAEIEAWNLGFGLPEVVEQLRTAVRDGLVHHLRDLLGVAAAIQRGGNPIMLLLAVNACQDAEIRALTEKDIEYVLEQLSPLFEDEEHMHIGSLVWGNYGRLLHIVGYSEAAENAYRKAIKLEPKAAWLWNNFGILLQTHLQLYDKAEQAYRESIRLDPNYAYPWNNLGNLLKDKLQRYDEAEQAYREAIRLDPKDAYPWNNLGILLKTHFQCYDNAEQAYRKAIKLDPSNANRWNSLGNLLQTHLQRYDEAKQAYREAISLDPKDAKPWNNLGNLLTDHLNRYDEAEQTYREAIRLDPKDAYPWNNLGILLKTHFQRYDEAEQAYREAIRLDPKIASTWNNLGNLLKDHLQRYDEAEQAYREAIRLDLKYAYPWTGLGYLLTDLNRHDEAEQAYREAIRLDSKIVYPWNGLGNLLADTSGQHEEAEQAYRQCLTLDSNHIVVKANLAYLLFDQPKRRQEAEDYYQQASEKLPVHGGALLRAYRAFTLDNIGDGINAFAAAINSNADELFSNFFDDMLRVLKLAEQRGRGEKLLAWFDESGVGERYWPLRAAFEAYVYGEAKLRDVNPEVRAAASRIYASLDRLRKGRTGAVKK